MTTWLGWILGSYASFARWRARLGGQGLRAWFLVATLLGASLGAQPLAFHAREGRASLHRTSAAPAFVSRTAANVARATQASERTDDHGRADPPSSLCERDEPRESCASPWRLLSAPIAVEALLSLAAPELTPTARGPPRSSRSVVRVGTNSG